MRHKISHVSVLLFTIAALTGGLLLAPLGAADSPQFRGPDRNGIFPESELLKSWPEGGPPQLWSVEGLGEGYASVSVSNGRIYTTGKFSSKGGETHEGKVFAFDLQGKKLWESTYGEEHSGNGYPGTRTTPTIDGDSLFLFNALGKAIALDAATGEKRWEVDTFARFDGKNTYFGAAESPLVLDGKVIVTPGGKDASVVALDRKTGETVWTTKGLSDAPGYCSPQLYEHGEHRQVVTLVAKHLVGIDPASGKVIWKTPVEASYDIHATSPVFDGNVIYVSHGYNHGGKAFRLAADGKSVSPMWTEEKLDIHHGGAVVVGGKIYGASSKKTWYALDTQTGERVAEISRLGKGSVIYADGLLYGYVESGDVLLVDPRPSNFKLISSFAIEKGSAQHWAHPVLSDGVLYIRHGEVLMAFDVKHRG